MKSRNLLDETRVKSIPTQELQNNEVVRTTPKIEPAFIVDSEGYHYKDMTYPTAIEFITCLIGNKAQYEETIELLGTQKKELKNELSRVKNICSEYQASNEALYEKLGKKMSFPLALAGISLILFLLSGFFAVATYNNIEKPVASSIIYPESIIEQKIEIAVQKERELLMYLFLKENPNASINFEDLLRGEAQIKGEFE